MNRDTVPYPTHQECLKHWPAGRIYEGDPLRICVLAHYSPVNKIDLPLIHQLHYLTQVARVVMVTQSNMTNTDLEFLTEHYCPAGVVTIPRCRGIDHTSYRVGLQHCQDTMSDFQEAKWLWLVNDGTYGPLSSMQTWKDRIHTMENTPGIGAWALTSSMQISYHLQSYFRAFHSKVFRSERFMKHLQKPWDTMTYWQIVNRGEVAMTADALGNVLTKALIVGENDLNPYVFRPWEVLKIAGIVKRKEVLAKFNKNREWTRMLMLLLPKLGLAPFHLSAWQTYFDEELFRLRAYPPRSRLRQYLRPSTRVDRRICSLSRIG